MADYKFGIQQEKTLLPTLKKTFENSLEKTKNKYCLYDFEGDTILIELKSRRCKSDTYSTTMIGHNKLQMAKRQSKDVYFCFGFTDGLFYHKFENDNEYHIEKGGRWDRGKAEISNYVFIPISQLTKVSQ